MIGIEYLWGGQIQLETSEVASISPPQGQLFNSQPSASPGQEKKITWQRVLYAMENRKLSKKVI